MRHITLPIALALFVPLSAQNWCPPGATWTFRHDDAWGQRIGHHLVEYAGDTVLGGLTSQRLAMSIHVYSYPQEEYLHYDMTDMFTATQGDLVLLWNTSTEVFDTLYRFDAVPGDQWSVPHAQDWAPNLVVTDTMHTVIDGVTLRQLVITMDSLFPTDTLTERIGFSRMFLDPIWTFLLDNPTGPLRCYSDNEISYVIPTWQYGCASLLGIDPHSSTNGPVLFPNPGSDELQLTCHARMNDALFTLRDATGRTVFSRSIRNERTVIDASGLAPGLFFWRLESDGGAVLFSGKWTKE